MTGGVVVVLGEVGRNFAAGMTGGTAFVWDPSLALKGKLAETAPAVRRAADGEEEILKSMVETHYELTGSPVAADILESGSWSEFWVVEPSGDVDHPSEIIILETADSGDPD
jgi:glutamate synthase (ferredoxin)